MFWISEVGSGPRYMICVTLFCTLCESENTLTCENCTRLVSRAILACLTCATCKNVGQNLIPPATAYSEVRIHSDTWISSFFYYHCVQHFSLQVKRVAFQNYLLKRLSFSLLDLAYNWTCEYWTCEYSYCCTCEYSYCCRDQLSSFVWLCIAYPNKSLCTATSLLQAVGMSTHSINLNYWSCSTVLLATTSCVLWTCSTNPNSRSLP